MRIAEGSLLGKRKERGQRKDRKKEAIRERKERYLQGRKEK